jgi:cytochrome c peroxidase
MRATTLAAAAALLGCSSASAPAPAVQGDAGSDGAGSLRFADMPPVPDVPVIAGDAPTDAKVTLGSQIFYDVRLSGTKTTNCNSCHLTQTVFQDNLIAATPDRTKPNQSPKLPRNTLSFMNLVYAPISRWDGSLGAPILGTPHAPATDLLDVLPFPFAEPNMNLGHDVPTAQATLKQRLTADAPGYVKAFHDAYAEDITQLDDVSVWHLVGQALRAFLGRYAISRDSAFDRWNAGDDAAMDASAQNGLMIFRGVGRCFVCHGGPFFTDFGFHNVSSSPPRADGTRKDEGRYYLTGMESDRGKFLTPTLRGAYDTDPYFHDGSASSLQSVLAHLSSTDVMADPNHDPIFDTPLSLGAQDTSDLIAFIKALRGAPAPQVVAPTTFP